MRQALNLHALAEALGAKFLDVSVAFPRFIAARMLLPCLYRRNVLLSYRFRHYFHRFAIRPLWASRSMMSFMVIMIGAVLAMQLAALGVQDMLEAWIARFAALVLAPLMACLYVLFRGFAPELVSLATGLGRGEANTWAAHGTDVWVQVGLPQWLAGIVAALALCGVQLLTLLLSSPMLTLFQALLHPGVRPFDLTLALQPQLLLLSLALAALTAGWTIAWCLYQSSKLRHEPETGGLIALSMVFPFCASFAVLEELAWLVA